MSHLPPILVKTNKPWKAAGILVKPAQCVACPLRTVGSGFVPDSVGLTPRVAIMLPTPTDDDLLENAPLSGGMGYYVFKNYLHTAGFRKDDLLLLHIIRCKPPWSARKRRLDYPTGVVRDKAETVCRSYDDQHGFQGGLQPGGLVKFNPDMFVLSLNPREAIRIPVYTRQIQRLFQRVYTFVQLGWRPLILCGNEPAELFAPFIKGQGGVKAWHMHFWTGEFKYNNRNNEGFIAV